MLSKTVLLLALIACFGCFAGSTTSPVDPNYQLKGKNYVQAKNYYLLTLLQTDHAAKKMLANDSALTKLCQTKITAIRSTLSCKTVGCFTAPLKFSPDEIALVGSRLAQLYGPDNALGKLVKDDLIPSGTYVVNKELSPKEQLVKAWEQDAEGMNYVISTYIDGEKPRYASIDSISFDVKALSYPAILSDAAATTLHASKNSKLFFEPVLNYALQALQINDRNDAANFEPLRKGLNKATLAKIKRTDWTKYRYTTILILGSGPSDYNTAISAVGMERCKMGATRYFAGLAPFVMVSGGKAHPYKTKFCEAVEMKKYLVDQLHVPADAVICETQARHTTTNVRNGVRLIYRYGIPADKPFLTVSTDSHISSVSTVMAARSLLELKVVPYTVGKRYDDNALELYPSLDAMQINPTDPLDPR